MRKMGIEADMYLTEAVEYFPQIFPVLQQIGMCCINEENQGFTMAELCIHHGVEPESFIEALNSII